jgi:hypothetical protein
VTVVEALGNAAKRLDTDLRTQPARRARLQETIAFTYFDLGLQAEGVPLMEKAVDYYRAARGPDHRDTLNAMSKLVHLYRSTERNDEAIALGEDTLERMRRILGPDSQDTLWLSVKLAEAYDTAKRPKEALAMRVDFVPRMSRVLGPENTLTLFGISGLAKSLDQSGQREEAFKLREQVLAARRKTLGPEHPYTLWAMNDLAGSLYWGVGRREEAFKLAEETAALMRKVLEPEHPWTFDVEDRLARWRAEREGKPPMTKPALVETLSRAGKFAEAAQATREIIETRGAGLGRSESLEWMNLAATLLAAGDRDGYRAACAEGVRRFQGTTDPAHAERMANICLLTPDPGVDAATIAALVATAQTVSRPWQQLLNCLAEYRAGHWDAAADWAAQIHADATSPGDSAHATAAAILALAEHQRKHPVEAGAALDAARTAIAANWPAGPGTSWHNWLIADLLAKEAEALLK